MSEENKDQQGDSNPFRFSVDDIVSAFSAALDEIQHQGYRFTLGDVLGAVNVMEIQVSEQIKMQYNTIMAARIAERQARGEPNH